MYQVPTVFHTRTWLPFVHFNTGKMKLKEDEGLAQGYMVLGPKLEPGLPDAKAHVLSLWGAIIVQATFLSQRRDGLLFHGHQQDREWDLTGRRRVNTSWT